MVAYAARTREVPQTLIVGKKSDACAGSRDDRNSS
jgi:hypothetical protein